MSNLTPRPASPVHPTQHQLDELEALMQRMLALPVNQLDEPANVSALPALAPMPEWESAPAVEMTAEPETDRRADGETEDTDLVSVAERLFPAVTAPEPEQPEEPEPAEPAPPVERMLPVMRAPIVVRPPDLELNGPAPAANKMTKPRAMPPRRLSRDRPGWGMRTLLWSNRAFDRRVGRWGSLGRWLRGPYGRALLGLVGLLLLIGAFVFGALDWIGWTW